MALWGKQDSKTASGTLTINGTTGAVTGTNTAFNTQAKTGNFIRVSGEDYQIVNIDSETSATVRAGTPGATMTAVGSAVPYTLSEKPAFISNNGNTVKATDVYGVDTTEISVGSDNVTSVAVGTIAGTRYLETPAVTFSGGGGSSAAATATISAGAVSAITVTNVGSSYTSAPTVVVAKPKRTIPTTGITAATDTIAYTAHGLAVNDEVKYNNGGGTSATGLTSGTSYYVAYVGLTANAFELKAAAGAPATLAGVAISGTGGQFTCTAATLAVNDRVRIDGTLGGTGSITSYATGTTYKVSAITGTSPSVTGFTLTTEAGVAIVTTAGTPTGLTYTTGTVIDITATGNNNQFFEIQAAADQATAVASLGAGSGGLTLTHAGWVRRTVGTGGRAGRVFTETLVAMGSMIGDQADDIQYPDA